MFEPRVWGARTEYDSAAEGSDSEENAPGTWDTATYLAPHEAAALLPMSDFIVCKKGRSKDDYKQIVQVCLMI